jgi:2-polyprenyl-3-methyl-5-hydroxy-6-metoxy-1,4-benzoquinol methylase
MENIANCPICNSPETEVKLEVIDHSVTREQFGLSFCKSCNFLFTKHPPSKENIGRYYKSVDYISHTDSSKGLFNRVYQIIRKYTLSNKRTIITRFLEERQSSKLLDYGCGTGAFLKEMLSDGWNVSGVEPDDDAREKASSLIKKEIDHPVKIYDFEDNSFDVITLWHVLEHVHDLHETLAQLNTLLTESGLIVIAVPNHLSHDAIHYNSSWAAYDVPRHLYHFNPASLQKLLRLHGLKIVKVLPMWFDSFYVSLLSEKYKYGKMRILPALFQGFCSNFNALIRPGTCSSQIYIVKKI